MGLIREPDLGTPPAAGELVTLTIDGLSVTVPAGTSLLRAAKLAGVSIPKLCATDQLDAFGSCRLCLVEIEGRSGAPRALPWWRRGSWSAPKPPCSRPSAKG
jgi:formate dehydrogenase major subunit